MNTSGISFDCEIHLQGKEMTHAELLQYLEALSGQKFRTKEDIHLYVMTVAAHGLQQNRNVIRWNKAKQILGLSLLGLAAIQYYIFDVLNEIFSLHQTVFFVPVNLASRLVTSMLVFLSQLV
jgi:hypothetical protein